MKNIKTILTIITLLCSSNAFSSAEVTTSYWALLSGAVPRSIRHTRSGTLFKFTLTPTSTYRDIQNQLQAVAGDVTISKVLTLQADGNNLVTMMDELLDTEISKDTRNKLSYDKEYRVILILREKS